MKIQARKGLESLQQLARTIMMLIHMVLIAELEHSFSNLRAM